MQKYFSNLNRVYSDRYELILSDVTITIQSYDEKTAEDLHEDCVKISGPYFIHFLRNKSSNSVTVGSGQAGSGRFKERYGRFIVLNDSASP